MRMTVYCLTPGLPGVRAPPRGIVEDALWAQASLSDGIEHIYVRPDHPCIWVVFLHHDSGAAGARVCDAAISASPALHGWTRHDRPEP